MLVGKGFFRGWRHLKGKKVKREMKIEMKKERSWLWLFHFPLNHSHMSGCLKWGGREGRLLKSVTCWNSMSAWCAVVTPVAWFCPDEWSLSRAAKPKANVVRDLLRNIPSFGMGLIVYNKKCAGNSDLKGDKCRKYSVSDAGERGFV